jgi:hypothetical protein
MRGAITFRNELYGKGDRVQAVPEMNGSGAGTRDIPGSVKSRPRCESSGDAKKKEDVNASGVKIGADELPSVTQLFTEDYMVDFLLDNTFGAWWAGKRMQTTEYTEKTLNSTAVGPGSEPLLQQFHRH